MQAPATPRIPVVFIGGFGRSGSTLLDLVLGQLDGFFSAGEFGLAWQRGFEENQLCGCNARFRNCPFWSSVVEEGFGSFARFDTLGVATLQREVDRLRDIPRLLVPLLRSRSYAGNLREYGAIIERLYGAVRTVSGCRVIIDSTKYPSHGFVLRSVPGIDLTPVHLVRDSRAVAYSWKRKRARPEVHWEQQYMPRFGGAQSSYRWMRANLLMEVLRKSCPGSVRIRYEDFIADPAAAIGAIVGRLGDGVGSPTPGRRTTLGENHTVAGNPLRFKRGEIELRLDDEWKERMAPGDYRSVTAMTLPLLRLYGYRSR